MKKSFGFYQILEFLGNSSPNIMECSRCIKYALFCVSLEIFLTSKLLCPGHPFTSYYFECNNCQGSCFPANPWVWNTMHILVLLHVPLCSTNL